MQRSAFNQLIIWRKSKYRKPLVIRGARQVGKSWLVREFGGQFDNYVELNLEEETNAHAFFEGSLNIQKLITNIELLTSRKITPGKTLLFLDEIQTCERALLALRYFKEKCPELHVIAAGSLLDFTLHKVGMPVGRVEFMYLYPLSFSEFLVAHNQDSLREHILTKNINTAIHDKILEYLHQYFWLGGMPEVIQAWINDHDATICKKIQDQIILSYQQDFEKYARVNEIPFVSKVFKNTPKQLGDKFKYVNVDPNERAKDLKSALLLLEKASIIHMVYHTSGQGHPLGASTNEKFFKVFFFDIGIANRLLNLDLSEWVSTKINVKHLGAICEQLVAQEYIAHSPITKPAELFYWQRENKNSSAEIDFLTNLNGDIIPIEVKAGKRGSLKSIEQYLISHPNTPYSVKISENNFSQADDLHGIPLYALESILKPDQDSD